MTRLRTGADDGMTLVELLLSMSILIIIATTISTAYITFLSTAAETSGRDDHSGGAAVLTSYLDRDLASATAYDVGTGCVAPGGTQRLRFTWTEMTATTAAPTPVNAGTFTVTYSTSPDPDSPAGVPQRYRLTRSECAPATTQSDRVLVPGMGSASILVTSAPGCSGPGTTGLKITVPSYSTDAAQPYRYVGCVGGRVG